MDFGSIIHKVLRAKYSGCEYVCGETYESLQWFCVDQPKPTEEQLIADIADYQANASIYDYKILRQTSYPSLFNQLDMLWHAMDSNEIPRANNFYNALKEIKDTYPKGVVIND